jgi:hypothetical protein
LASTVIWYGKANQNAQSNDLPGNIPNTK